MASDCTVLVLSQVTIDPSVYLLINALEIMFVGTFTAWRAQRLISRGTRPLSISARCQNKISVNEFKGSLKQEHSKDKSIVSSMRSKVINDNFKNVLHTAFSLEKV